MARTAYDVIIRPIITEQSMEDLDIKKYVFEVAKDANKVEIKQAVEKIFNVKVVSVNTLHRIGKRQRTRFGYGKRADQKRAIVTLAAGQQIDVFGNN